MDATAGRDGWTRCIDAMCRRGMDAMDGRDGWARWMDAMDGSDGRTRWADAAGGLGDWARRGALWMCAVD